VEEETEFLFTTPFTEDDWLEAVNLYSPAQFSCGKQRAVATLTGYVEDFDKLKSCIHWLRGYAWVDENLELRRSRPARHPIWKNLVCTEILEATGISFLEKQEIIANEDLAFAAYRKFKITASFTSVPYLIYEDGEVDTEDERWTSFNPKPYVEFYEVPAGEFKFVANDPVKDWHNTAIPGPRAVVRSQKSLYELKWYEVPLSMIYDEDGATPKLDAAIGKVSSDEYAGKPAGVWLVDDVDVEIYSDPIVGDLLETPGRMANVTFYLKKWDPDRGHASNTTRGWNLELAVDGKAYPITRQVGTEPKYQGVAIASLFTHHTL
jgi:hypothetical protein